MTAIARLLKQHLKHGTLVLNWPTGTPEKIVASSEPLVSLHISKWSYKWKLLIYPNYALPEGYVNGDIEIEAGTLRQLLEMLTNSIPDDQYVSPSQLWLSKMEPAVDYIRSAGSRSRSSADVQFHYDLSNAFFEKMLDPLMQYSCAFFEPWDEPLENAQIHKIQHIMAKLQLKPSSSVLDIGSGWGSLANQIAKSTKGEVTGLTVSNQQLAYANSRWRRPNLHFVFEDYRDHPGQYDRIVSVGMLEHVGRHHYDDFFSKVRSLLKEDGVALIHTIGRRGPPTPINPWIRRHIFPGAYIPSLSQLSAVIERQGLWTLDCENLRFHYAKTLECWYQNILKHKDYVLDEFGERFFRAWEFYLLSCEQGFLNQGLTVYQLLVGITPDSAPLSRTYMFKEEERLRKQALMKEKPRKATKV